MALEVNDLAKVPPAVANMAFSKIANLRTLPEEEVLAFFNGLLQAAVLSRYDGDWSRVERLVDEMETRLISTARPNALRFESSPWTPFRKRLSEARIVLITTGGAYVKTSQPPFKVEDSAADASFREIPTATPREAIGVSHTHYDTSGAQADINVIFPYERLKEMAAEGVIGSLAEPFYGFMGYITGDEVNRLISETAPEVARRLAADKADAALIGTT
jgi:D-proline reductase (dithiol) PrdB